MSELSFSSIGSDYSDKDSSSYVSSSDSEDDGEVEASGFTPPLSELIGRTVTSMNPRSEPRGSTLAPKISPRCQTNQDLERNITKATAPLPPSTELKVPEQHTPLPMVPGMVLAMTHEAKAPDTAHATATKVKLLKCVRHQKGTPTAPVTAEPTRTCHTMNQAQACSLCAPLAKMNLELTTEVDKLIKIINMSNIIQDVQNSYNLILQLYIHRCPISVAPLASKTSSGLVSSPAEPASSQSAQPPAATTTPEPLSCNQESPTRLARCDAVAPPNVSTSLPPQACPPAPVSAQALTTAVTLALTPALTSAHTPAPLSPYIRPASHSLTPSPSSAPAQLSQSETSLPSLILPFSPMDLSLEPSKVIEPSSSVGTPVPVRSPMPNGPPTPTPLAIRTATGVRIMMPQMPDLNAHNKQQGGGKGEGRGKGKGKSFFDGAGTSGIKKEKKGKGRGQLLDQCILCGRVYKNYGVLRQIKQKHNTYLGGGGGV